MDPGSEAVRLGGADDVLLGDVRALACQLGGEPSDADQAGRKPAASRWTEWAGRYVTETLVHEEWPVVIEAWNHAAHGRVSEILDLDRRWGMDVGLRPMAEASFRAGQRQLNRLRPLKDVRVIQRYLHAIESGLAHGWHPVVYGVMLATYGIPLRQGLMHYAEQILGGLAEGMPGALGAVESARESWIESTVAELPAALGRLLPDTACQIRLA